MTTASGTLVGDRIEERHAPMPEITPRPRRPVPRSAVSPAAVALVVALAICHSLVLAPAPVLAQPAPDNSNAGNSPAPAADPLGSYFRDNKVYDGTDLRAWMRSGQTNLRMGKFDAAQGAFEKALSLEDRHVVAMHLCGLAMFARGEFVRASRMIRGAISRFPVWTRLAFDLADQFGSTGGAGQEGRLKATADLVAATSNITDSDAAADLWFLLGYLTYYTAAAPDVDILKPALIAFQNATRINPSDAASREFIRALAERGVKPEGEQERREFGLPADRQWLVPGLREFARRDFSRAAMAFMSQGMTSLTDPEPWLWAAIALAADGRTAHAAAMIRRGLLGDQQSELAGLPALGDLLPDTVIATRRSTLATKAGAGDHEAALVAGYLAFLAGDVPGTRALLADLAAMDQRPDEPDHPARFGPAARWMMKFLSQRSNPPHIDLSTLNAGGTPPDNGAATNSNTPAGNSNQPPDNAANTNTPASNGTTPGANNANTGTGNTPPANNSAQPAPPTEADVARDVQAAIDTGDKAFMRNDTGSALVAYQAAFTIGTGFNAAWFDSAMRADLYLKLARVEFALADYGNSQTALNRYLMAIPEPARKAQQVFEAPFADDAFDPALRNLAAHVRRTPTDRGARFVLGYLRFSAGDYIGALEHFTLVINDQSDGATFPIAEWFVNLLVQPPFNADRADPSARAARIVAEGNKLLADKLYETASLEFQRAYELTPTDAILVDLLAALWLRAAEDDYTPDQRVDVFRRMANALRHHILSRDRDTWINLKLDFNRVLAADAKRCRAVLDTHVRNKPADFNSWYFRAFVNYFDRDWSECLRSFGEYKATARDAPTSEFEFFRAGARMSGNNR